MQSFSPVSGEQPSVVTDDLLKVIVQQAVKRANGSIQIQGILRIGDSELSILDHYRITSDQRFGAS